MEPEHVHKENIIHLKSKSKNFFLFCVTVEKANELKQSHVKKILSLIDGKGRAIEIVELIKLLNRLGSKMAARD